MTWETLSGPILSLLGVVFAGAGLKFVEGWLKKTKDKDDTATNLRQELRNELTALKADMAKVEKELDEWKGKYYEVIERYIIAKAQLEAALKVLAERGTVIPPPAELPQHPKKGDLTDGG